MKTTLINLIPSQKEYTNLNWNFWNTKEHRISYSKAERFSRSRNWWQLRAERNREEKEKKNELGMEQNGARQPLRRSRRSLAGAPPEKSVECSWRERREGRRERGKNEKNEPVPHIYILPKLQIQPYNYLNHLKLSQITTKYLYSTQLIFIKQSTPKVILKIHFKI